LRKKGLKERKKNYEPERYGRGRKARKSKRHGGRKRKKIDSLNLGSVRKNKNYEPRTPSKG
jgi:hypothetical protein